MSNDGIGTRVVLPVDRQDFNNLKQLVEYMDSRLIEVERELERLLVATREAKP